MDDLLELPTNGRFPGALAVVDKTVVPEVPLVAMNKEDINDVPLIFGTTAQEADLSPSVIFGNSEIERYRTLVQKRLGIFGFKESRVNFVLEMYNRTLPDGSLPSLHIGGDRFASHLSKQQSGENCVRRFQKPCLPICGDQPPIQAS